MSKNPTGGLTAKQLAEGRAARERITAETQRAHARERMRSQPGHTTAPSPDDGLARARAEGALAERERIRAILALPQAAKRRETAVQVALTTDMAVGDVQALLAGLPEESGGRDAFSRHMDGIDHPALGAMPEIDPDSTQAKVAEILAAQRGRPEVARKPGLLPDDASGLVG